MNTAIVSACLAYVIWGLFPLYIKQLPGVPALEIVLHRAWWAMVFVVALLAWQRRFAWLRPVLAQPRALASALACALLIGANWLLYVWAVAGGRVVDASLGYFINPLFNVLLGTLVLGERPRPVQWLAVALAAAGVGWLVLGAGEWPWVALLLAATFGGYGLLRKTAALGPVEGLALETMLLAPVAGAGLLWLVAQGQDAATHQGRPPSPGCWPRGPSPPSRCCCSRAEPAASRWPRWACCSTSARRCSSCLA